MIIMTNQPYQNIELLSNIAKLSFLSIAGFFTMKWLMDHLDPTKTQKKEAKKKALEQLCKLGIPGISNLTDYEMVVASHLIDPKEITVHWSCIGGLDSIIREIKDVVILPVMRKDLFSDSQLIQPPKGILLAGPPGCGKTMIAKATAKESGMRFINLDLAMLTDKWYGESQKLTNAVFSLAVKLQPAIIFIDEIDSFLRNRSTNDHEATAMMKALFLTLWDGLVTDPDCTVIVMGATNRPQDLDRAILRRMSATFNIGLPDADQRREILELLLTGEPVSSNVNLYQLSIDCEGFTGSDLRELCRTAAIYRVKDYVNSSSRMASKLDKVKVRSINMDDLENALQKMKESRSILMIR